MSQKKSGLSRRAVMAGLGGACASVPLAAQAQFSIGIGGFSTNDLKNIGRMLKGLSLGEADELRMGETYFGPIVDFSGGVYANGAVQSALRRCAAPLFETATRTAFAWDVVVVDNNEINAWVLPGGKMAVNKGLLRYVANEQELAAVLAHEMGHAELSHALSEIKKKSFADGLTGVAQKALVHELEGNAAAAASIGLGALGGALLRLVTSGYARKSELEADQHILSVFERTGHNVGQGAEFYRTLLQTIPKKSKGTTSLFAGHPETQKRLDLLLEGATGAPGNGAHIMSSDFAVLKETFPTRRFYMRHG